MLRAIRGIDEQIPSVFNLEEPKELLKVTASRRGG
jgi:hypothetical protein